MEGAVAVDFGASSGRYAVGRLVDGRIQFDVVEQRPHHPQERDGVLCWDLSGLLCLCREAAAYASAHFPSATIGIDTWGVDHGFVNADGDVIGEPVCYRDLSHVRAFEKLRPHRNRLYELTGCQHQPFNTICQLVARSEDAPHLKDAEWFVLPDLLGYVLTGERNHELTQASTTQLLGLDGSWSEEAFAIAGWRVPKHPPRRPGTLGGEVVGQSHVRLAHVGSHDTASAVCGFGRLGEDQMFLNVGTWSLAGVVIDEPIATAEAEAAAFTNERTVDGRVRFLKNIPGFYVINRLHEELGVGATVPQWLSGLEPVDERVDLLHPDLYNPESMVETCARLAGRRHQTEGQWAGLALSSLTHTIAQQPPLLERLTGRRIRSIRVGGGGSLSHAFCQSLANESGLEVVAGPAEATVLGNLAMQFLASGRFESFEDMLQAVDRSAERRVYAPLRPGDLAGAPESALQ